MRRLKMEEGARAGEDEKKTWKGLREKKMVSTGREEPKREGFRSATMRASDADGVLSDLLVAVAALHADGKQLS